MLDNQNISILPIVGIIYDAYQIMIKKFTCWYVPCLVCGILTMVNNCQKETHTCEYITKACGSNIGKNRSNGERLKLNEWN